MLNSKQTYSYCYCLLHRRNLPGFIFCQKSVKLCIFSFSLFDTGVWKYSFTKVWYNTELRVSSVTLSLFDCEIPAGARLCVIHLRCLSVQVLTKVTGSLYAHRIANNITFGNSICSFLRRKDFASQSGSLQNPWEFSH